MPRLNSKASAILDNVVFVKKDYYYTKQNKTYAYQGELIFAKHASPSENWGEKVDSFRRLNGMRQTKVKNQANSLMDDVALVCDKNTADNHRLIIAFNDPKKFELIFDKKPVIKTPVINENFTVRLFSMPAKDYLAAQSRYVHARDIQAHNDAVEALNALSTVRLKNSN